MYFTTTYSESCVLFFSHGLLEGRQPCVTHHIIYLTKNLAPINSGDSASHEQINYTPSKMSSSKKLTCKGTSRLVFIRVYRLEIQSVMLVFSSQLCELLPFYPSLWFNSPPFPLSVCELIYCLHV
jgi:hypothetical protein